MSRDQIPELEPPKGGGCDMTHRGPSDFYGRWDRLLRERFEQWLEDPEDNAFTTPWGGCKHEILSSKVTANPDGSIECEVSVSDDLDNGGYGRDKRKGTWEDGVAAVMRSVERGMAKAHQLAVEDQDANQDFRGFSVGTLDTKTDHRSWNWTFYIDLADHPRSEPPGDYVHRWGWQEVPEDTDDQDHMARPEAIPEAVAQWVDDTANHLVKFARFEHQGTTYFLRDTYLSNDCELPDENPVYEHHLHTTEPRLDGDTAIDALLRIHRSMSDPHDWSSDTAHTVGELLGELGFTFPDEDAVGDGDYNLEDHIPRIER